MQTDAQHILFFIGSSENAVDHKTASGVPVEINSPDNVQTVS
jgi:hypothetical protein